MMNPDKKPPLLPVRLIALGIGWLLSTLGVLPAIDWIWTLGLAALGLLAFVAGRFNKVTVEVGPFFIIASFLSILPTTATSDECGGPVSRHPSRSALVGRSLIKGAAPDMGSIVASITWLSRSLALKR